MKISVLPSTSDSAHVLLNMWPAYMHDVSQFSDDLPNPHGLFEYEDVEAYPTPMQMIWWEKPNVLFPYLIQVDGRPAGFSLVASPPHVSPEVDYNVNDFFLLHPYRGKGIGQKAAHDVFDRRRGKWELCVLPENRPAISFWRKAIEQYTSARNFHETLGPTAYSQTDMVLFRFDNGEDQPDP